MAKEKAEKKKVKNKVVKANSNDSDFETQQSIARLLLGIISISIFIVFFLGKS